MNIAWRAEQPGAPPVDDLLQALRAARLSRREFLAVSGGSLALATLAASRTLGASIRARPSRNAPRIAIVGAGLAGLNAAYHLRKAGYASTVYSAPDRLGGRVASATGVLGPGLVTELGGEFIDTQHQDMRGLAAEYGIPLLDLTKLDSLDGAYYFRGRHFTEREVVQAFRPLARRIAADQNAINWPVTFRQYGNARALDLISVRAYLDRIGAVGPIYELLDVAYVSEYGLDSDRQSSLNLIGLIGTDTSQGFRVYGDSDDRFKVEGGNFRIVEELAQRLPGQIELGSRLVAIRSAGKGFILTFDTAGGPVETAADIVILAIPFTALRQVALQVALPAWKRYAIQSLGYGTNSKILIGFRSRPWLDRNYSGDSFTDLGFQNSWDNSSLESGPAGGLTLMLGGAAGLAVGAGTAAQQAGRHFPALEQVFPGSVSQSSGAFARAVWPEVPLINASYACYTVGQYTSVAGAEILPIGNLFFAGEHCSLDFQGYMEGALQTGRQVAASVLARIKT
jgi:monoamine oxidase